MTSSGSNIVIDDNLRTIVVIFNRTKKPIELRAININHFRGSGQ